MKLEVREPAIWVVAGVDTKDPTEYSVASSVSDGLIIAKRLLTVGSKGYQQDYSKSKLGCTQS